MVAICPTVTAYDLDEYRAQVNRLMPFAARVHIDLMDGQFAPTESPSLDQVWLPPHKICDIHLMYQKPMDCLQQLIKLRPNMVVIHNEAEVHHMYFAAELHKEGIKAGLALLPDTPVHYIEQIMHSFDHILIFSGNLGHHGGQADMGLLNKVQEVRALHSDAEIGWDGGINDANVQRLTAAGVDVLNVGGYVQHAGDPAAAYARLEALVESS
jgi:ribulose-phosphate 3-epimerase